MNTHRTAPRILSFALAALVTASMLSGIDSLARDGRLAHSLMARIASLASSS